MPQMFGEARSPEEPFEDQLNSWKEIAAYFNRDVTTVQRWEKREGMPVHRHLHDKIGSIYAFRTQLEAWARTRNLKGNGNQEVGGAASAVEVTSSAEESTLPPQTVTSTRSPRRLFLRWTLPLVVAVAVAAVIFFLRSEDYFWRNPLENARFQTITDFDGEARDAALARDGHLVAFLSDHDGPVDVWVTQIGSGTFHNLTHGGAADLVNPDLRALGFSPDCSLVTFWTRKHEGPVKGIGVWGIPTLGGQPQPYLDGVAEFDWSADASRLVYHTPGPGDPLFVTEASKRSNGSPILTAPSGQHSHFPLWSPDAAYIYFVQGALPDKMDIWRIGASGGKPERITSRSGYIRYPVFLDRDTLLYLESDPDGSGPWLYEMNVHRRVAHRLTTGPERYVSLAASPDGRRVVATLSNAKRTLWHLPLGNPAQATSAPTPIPLTTSAGFYPRLGPKYLLYVSSTGSGDSIWKFADGRNAELWSGQDARISAAPAISPDGASIAFPVRQNNHERMYVMQADGTNTRIVAEGLDLQGAPAWAHDGRSLTAAVMQHGVPHLFQIPIDGKAPAALVSEYSVDPVWEKTGRFVAYSGADIGTTFSLKAAKPDGMVYTLPSITLSRGARHAVFAPGGHLLILLRGEIRHKDLWSIDLDTGAEQQLTKLPADFDIRDFDLSPDGRELVMERVQERSDIVLLDFARR